MFTAVAPSTGVEWIKSTANPFLLMSKVSPCNIHQSSPLSLQLTVLYYALHHVLNRSFIRTFSSRDISFDYTSWVHYSFLRFVAKNIDPDSKHDMRSSRISDVVFSHKIPAFTCDFSLLKIIFFNFLFHQLRP